MKPVLAALVSASLATFPLAALAQHHGGHGGGGPSPGGGPSAAGPSPSAGASGGWRGGGGGSGMHGGGGHWNGGSGSWAGGWRGGGFGGGFRGGGFPHHHFRDHGCWGCFGGFAFGLALGSAWDPWYWDYPAYTIVEHEVYPDPGYYYDRYQRDYDGAPAPRAEATRPPPDGPCDKWQWDATRSQYYWVACPSSVPPPR